MIAKWLGGGLPQIHYSRIFNNEFEDLHFYLVHQVIIKHDRIWEWPF